MEEGILKGGIRSWEELGGGGREGMRREEEGVGSLG